MATLMIFPELAAEEQLRLCPQDFPENFTKDYCHPDDYKVFERRVDKQLIFNHRQGKFNRLLLRVCWRTKAEEYVPMTFVLDTGAPKHLYLSQRAIRTLQSHGTLHTDDDTDLLYVIVDGRKCPVETTPPSHDPANIIGVHMLMRFGLCPFEDEYPFFSLNRLSDAIQA